MLAQLSMQTATNTQTSLPMPAYTIHCDASLLPYEHRRRSAKQFAAAMARDGVGLVALSSDQPGEYSLYIQRRRSR